MISKKIKNFIFVGLAFSAFLFILGLIDFSGGLENKKNLTAGLIAGAEVESENSKNKEEELKEKIGQMIMVGFRGTEAKEGSDIYRAVKEAKIGGVILFDFDVPSASFPRNIISPGQTKDLVSGLQNLSETPLFIAADAEGGAVNRFKKEYGFEEIISAEEMAKKGKTGSYAEKLAKQLQELGVNMNFAPVVDVNLNPKNSAIGAIKRAFSSDENEVYENAKIFIEKHKEYGIITSPKHFPGQGGAKIDSHVDIADITQTYQAKEVVPFDKLNQNGLLFSVMTAHAMDKNIDPENPATLSGAFLQGVLREQIGFEGVIISDDMQMGAIEKNYGFSDAIIKAVNAGCDIILISNNTQRGYDKDVAHKVREIILGAVRRGLIDEAKIHESYDRIMGLKRQFGL